MSRVICDLTIAAAGYAAGLDQTAERPFGDDGSGAQLHARVFETPDEDRAEVDRMAAPAATAVARRRRPSRGGTPGAPMITNQP